MTKTNRLPLFLLAVMLTACSLSQQPPVELSPTPEATLTHTPVPLPTQTPLPPPTPTIQPALLLQAADQYLTNGYFDHAVQTYQTLMAQTPTADYGAAAALRLGRAALREGMFTSAVEALTLFIQQYPGDPNLAQAFFLRGDAYLGLSRWQEAISDFEQYRSMRPGLIDSYVYERIADAQLALGQAEASLENYQLAISAIRAQVPLLALREKVAQIYRTSGYVSEAVAQYDAILSVAQNEPYRASMEMAAAQAMLDGGQTDQALSRLGTLLDTYPATEAAYQALNILLAHDVSLDTLISGRVRFNYGDYEGALDDLTRYSITHTLAAIPAELHLMLGRSYREMGNSAAAVTAFQTIVDQYPNDALFGEALLEQGRTKFLLGDVSGAIVQYLEIAENYAYLTDTAAEALWRAGYLYGTNDQPLEARQVFERLADTYPNTAQTRSGLFLAASAAVNLGETARAEQLFSRVAATSTGTDAAEAYLWLGRLAMQRNDTARTQQMLQLATEAAPDGYFSARAQDLLANRAPFAPPAGYQFYGDDMAELSTAEDWLRQTFNIQQDGMLWPLSVTLQADPRLIRGQELWDVAAFAEAQVEFNDLLSFYSQDALASYQLAIHLRGIGAYRASILGAANLITLSGVGTLDAPVYLARLRYPIYYLDVVEEIAGQYGMDPLLLFSLIRLESLFDTTATAAAGEKGLTQVIPSTADYIANQLQWPNYQHSDLFRPHAGIAFGAYYLDEQLRRFDGSVPAALAGYNAGPGRAMDWLALSGGDPDLFLTTITIDSTRNYVQLIYSFYSIYRTLYGQN